MCFSVFKSFFYLVPSGQGGQVAKSVTRVAQLSHCHTRVRATEVSTLATRQHLLGPKKKLFVSCNPTLFFYLKKSLP